LTSPKPGIDRRALVARHNITDPALTDALLLGNGECCFGVDATGLQTLAGNTMAHWAKHSAPLPADVSPDDIPETGTHDTGRITGHMLSPTRKCPAGKWMVDNPHPINLGRLSLTGGDGKLIELNELTEPERALDLWTGLHTARFEWQGQPVTVETVALPGCDALAARVCSPLLAEGKLQVRLDFPMPEPGPWPAKLVMGDFSAESHAGHQTTFAERPGRLTFNRQIDDDAYAGTWRLLSGDAAFDTNPAAHHALLIPNNACTSLEFLCAYASDETDVAGLDTGLDTNASSIQSFQDALQQSAAAWETFWLSGGAIDLSESRDDRWHELERRVVLSQYLMRTNNAGSLPPAEFALTNVDLWQGEFHMEMVWWHLAHYALWGRWHLAEPALGVYEKFLPIARKRAEQLDYTGAKWGKQESPDGLMTPWVGNLELSWQQPHPIFFAELDYRDDPSQETLEKWRQIVFESAEYMASFATLREDGHYHLEHVMTANETGTCHDPVFECTYWRWGLDAAQQWRQRLGLEPKAKWQRVRDGLAPLPTRTDSKTGDTIYAWCDQWVDLMWSDAEPRAGHPDPIGPFAFLPFVTGVDPQVAANTAANVHGWKMGWGWDCPWYAMAAARCGRPDVAIDVLLEDTPNNVYSARGICKDWYFPGNGATLYAVAMMAAGWDGGPERHAPGFPDDGQWVVRHEGLRQAL